MKTRKLVAVGLAVALLMANVPSALAFPPLPSSFYGAVKVNGANVPDGTVVSAWINGVRYAYRPVSLYLGDTTYGLDVPGDDLSTSGIIEGGREGDVIRFRIGDLPAEQTGAWHSGTNVQLNLTYSEADVSLAQTDSPDPVVAGNPLAYALTVVNHGPAGATGVVVTDTLPASVLYGSATSSQGNCNKVSNTVSCSLGDLIINQSASVTIVVSPTIAGSIVNTATVTSDRPDLSIANNLAVESTLVQHAALTSIHVTPDPATATSDEAVTYTVMAQDAYVNTWDVTPQAAFSISAGAGGMWTGNVYTTQVAGRWTVTATYGTAVNTAQLTVNRSGVDHIVLTPTSATRSTGESVIYGVTAYDIYGNNWDVTTVSVFTITTAAGGSWADNVYTSQKAGRWTVTAIHSGKTATATLTVNPGQPYSLALQAALLSQVVGNSIALTATVTDQGGNPVANDTSVTFTVDLGSAVSPQITSGGIALSSIGSTVAGTAHITATSGPAQGTATVTFTPGPLSKIRVQVSPSTLVVNSGGAAPVTATAMDVFDNGLSGIPLSGQVSPPALGSVSGMGATSASGQTTGMWTPGSVAGIGWLSVGNGAISGTAPITLNNPLPAITSLSPNTVMVGSAAFTLTITGTNLVGDSKVYWNGAIRPTTFDSSTRVWAAIHGEDVAITGTVHVTVVNPAPGGGTSNVATFTVVVPSPAPESHMIYLPIVSQKYRLILDLALGRGKGDAGRRR